MNSINKDYKKVEFKTLDGRNLAVLFKLLKRKDAWNIYNTSVKLVVKSIGTAAISIETGNIDHAAKAFDSLDNDLIWDLAQSILRGAAIYPDAGNPDDFEQIESLENAEWFDDNWNDLYLFIYQGIQANYPKSIAQLTGKLGAFGDRMKGMAEKLTGQNTPLTEG